MSKQRTLFEELGSDETDRRLLAQEAAILEVTELICQLMEEQSVSRAELARRLGKSRAYVTQMLDGSTNLTIRTIADVLFALGAEACFSSMVLRSKTQPAAVEPPRNYKIEIAPSRWAVTSGALDGVNEAKLRLIA